MRVWMLMAALALAGVAMAQGDPWAAMTAADAAARQTASELKVVDEALAALREAAPDAADIVPLRKAVADAEAAVKAAQTAAGLDDLQARRDVARSARDKAADVLVADASTFAAVLARQQTLATRIAELTGRLPKLTDAEVTELAEARLEQDRLDRTLYYSRRALWSRGEVKPLYEKADRLYSECGTTAGKAKALTEANAALRAAEKKLADARAAQPLTGPLAEGLAARKADLAAKLAQQEAAAKAATDAIIGGGEKVYDVTIPRPDKNGKKQPPMRGVVWIPAGVKTLRGLVAGHEPVLGTGLLKHRTIQAAAASMGMGTVALYTVCATFNWTGDDAKNLQTVLDALAAKSGHPEVASAPLLTVGHSTSGIYCRNVAFWQPDRVIGIIHIKSGNFHQGIAEKGKSFAGVPCLVVNGEFEEFGPEGGIQPAYGNQTQWVMAREQMLRFRTKDPNYLFSYIVDPGGSHTSWNGDLDRIAAMFIRKAAAARLPEPGADATKCRPVDLKSGWLSDPDLDHPTIAPAPYADYRGDKTRAFWHLDGEMAQAIAAYLQDRIILPDPTKKTPVPATWAPMP